MKVFNGIKDGLLKAGAKMMPNAGKYIKKVAPVMTASMVLKQVQEIPFIDKVFDGLSRLWDMYNENFLNKIPVIGWVNEKLGEYVAKPVAKLLGGYRDKENDESWYTGDGAKMPPSNANRSMRYGDNLDIFRPYKGDVPSLACVNIDCPDFDYAGLDLLVTNLDENITFGLQRNQSYTPAELKAFLVNSIGYYLIGKQLERKIGFSKYQSFSNNYFREMWIQKYEHVNESSRIIASTTDARFDLTDVDAGFVLTNEIWDAVCKLDYTLMIPKKMKEWIDHYCGSVFVMDEDVHNNKYFYFRFNNVQLLELSANKQSYTKMQVNLDDLDYVSYYNQLKLWFANTKDLRSDISKAVIVINSKKVIDYLVSGFDYAWFKSYADFTPEFTAAKSAKQALINCYTKDAISSINLSQGSFLRLDYLDDSFCGDPFTSILFLGAMVPDTHPLFKVKGFAPTSMDIVCYGSDAHPVVYPAQWDLATSYDALNGSPTPWSAYVTKNTPVVFRITTQAQDLIKLRSTFTGPKSSASTVRWSPYDLGPSRTSYTDTTVNLYNCSVDSPTAGNFNVKMNLNGGAIRCTLVAVPLFRINTGHDAGQIAYGLRFFDHETNMCKRVNTIFWTKRPQNEAMALVLHVLYTSQSSSGAYFFRSVGFSQTANNTQVEVNAILSDTAYNSFTVSDIQTWAGALGLVTATYDDSGSQTGSLSGAITFNTAFPSKLVFAPTGNSDLTTYKYAMTFDSNTSVSSYTTDIFTTAITLNNNAYVNNGWGVTGTRLYIIYDYTGLYEDGVSHYYEGTVTSTTNWTKANQFVLSKDYYEYWFTALGFSIPMIKSSKFDIYSYVTDGNGKTIYASETFVSDYCLLKEDYVPFIINVRDLPATYYKMFNSLLNFENVETKKITSSE